MTRAAEPGVRLSRLKLTFACRDGRTYLAEGFSEGPLKVLRPFALGDGRVLVQLLNVGPGLLAGDRYDLQVRLRAGARVVLVGQSATKLHRMPPGGRAQQALLLEVEEGAELELLPGLTLPFTESDAAFETTVQLAEGARFALLEAWAMGRIGRGERFTFRRLSSRLRVRYAGRLVYADGLELTPATAPYTGITDGFSYLAAGFWEWDTPWPAPLQPDSSTLHLVTGPCGPERGYLRALASDGLTLTQTLQAHLNRWHEQRGVAPVPFGRLML